MYMERMCYAVGGFNLIDAEHGRRGLICRNCVVLNLYSMLMCESYVVILLNMAHMVVFYVEGLWSEQCSVALS